MTAIEWLVDLHDRGILFLRDQAYRVLHVVTPGWLREATLRVVRNLGNRVEARGPVLVIDAVDGDGADGWEARARQLRELAEAADGGEGHGEKVAGAVEGGGLLGFAEQLVAIAMARGQVGEELVVALAPGPVRARDRWEQAVGLLLGSELLRGVRWIFVEVDVGVRAWRGVPEGAVLVHGVGADGRAGSALEGGLGGGLVGGSGAGPVGMVPPPRAGRGQAIAGAGEKDRELARHVAAAAAAMGRQRADEAVEQQCRARDLAVKGQRVEQAVVMELVLAGYLLSAAAGTQAIASCERAVGLAKERGLEELTAIGLMTLGTCRMARGDMPGALVAFAGGAACADQSQSVPLAVEACRLTGEVALELGMEGQAVSFWARGIKRGQAAGGGTGEIAGVVARCEVLLERLCRERGVAVPTVCEGGVPEGMRGPLPRPVQVYGVRTERLRGWTAPELRSLRESWRAVVDEETTGLLSADELAVIHGWKELPAPRVAVVVPGGAHGLVSGETVAGGTELLDPEELAAIRRRLRCTTTEVPKV